MIGREYSEIRTRKAASFSELQKYNASLLTYSKQHAFTYKQLANALHKANSVIRNV